MLKNDLLYGQNDTFGPKKVIFELFLACFKISFSSLHNPSHNLLLLNIEHNMQFLYSDKICRIEGKDTIQSEVAFRSVMGVLIDNVSKDGRTVLLGYGCLPTPLRNFCLTCQSVTREQMCF